VIRLPLFRIVMLCFILFLFLLSTINSTYVIYTCSKTYLAWGTFIDFFSFIVLVYVQKQQHGKKIDGFLCAKSSVCSIFPFLLIYINWQFFETMWNWMSRKWGINCVKCLACKFEIYFCNRSYLFDSQNNFFLLRTEKINKYNERHQHH